MGHVVCRPRVEAGAVKTVNMIDNARGRGMLVYVHTEEL
jgi:hypothetical protein